MDPLIWVGVAASVLGLAFLINSVRVLRKSTAGHAANAARLHIPVVLVFLPVIWITIWVMQA
jgi:hypothetical protein